MKKSDSNEWDLIIESKSNLFDFKIAEIWRYRDLLLVLIRRDIVSFYKQTILGPVWFFLQPIFTVVVFIFVFSKLAGLSTDNLPQPLFYLSGIISWSYFSECLNKTSTVFKDNAHIFGKVYFPRIVMPLSIIISNLLKFSIQMSLFFVVYLYYFFLGSVSFFNEKIIFFPVFVLFMGMQGLGLGMIVSAMTTKYRDLIFLLTFGVQLMMYSTTVIYPLSSLSGTMYQVVALNPMTYIIEGIRACLLNQGVFNLYTILYSGGISVFILVFGIFIFNKVEKSFVDTI